MEARIFSSCTSPLGARSSRAFAPGVGTTMRDAMRVRLIIATDFLSWGRAPVEPFALGVGMTMRDAMRDANFFTFSFRSSGSGYRFPFGYGGALSDAVARRGSYLLWRLVVGCPSSLYVLRRLF